MIVVIIAYRNQEIPKSLLLNNQMNKTDIFTYDLISHKFIILYGNEFTVIEYGFACRRSKGN